MTRPHVAEQKEGGTRAVPSTNRVCSQAERRTRAGPSPKLAAKWLKNGYADGGRGDAHATFSALAVPTAASPTFSRVVWPVASRHRSIASRRATATIARLRARVP